MKLCFGRPDGSGLYQKSDAADARSNLAQKLQPLCRSSVVVKCTACRWHCRPAACMLVNEAQLDRIADQSRKRLELSCVAAMASSRRWGATACGEHSHTTGNQLARPSARKRAGESPSAAADVDCDVLTFKIACLVQALAERADQISVARKWLGDEEPYHGHCRLLRPRHHRPHRRGRPSKS